MSDGSHLPLCHIYILLLWEFFPAALAGRFSLVFEGQQDPQFSRTCLSILDYIDNAVLLIVIICTLISMSSSPFTDSLETVLSAQMPIGINSVFIFQRFFFVSSFFFFFDDSCNSCNMAEIRGSIYILKSLRSLCIAFSRADSGLYFKNDPEYFTKGTAGCLSH